jgi:replicative DNA helicase
MIGIDGTTEQKLVATLCGMKKSDIPSCVADAMLQHGSVSQFGDRRAGILWEAMGAALHSGAKELDLVLIAKEMDRRGTLDEFGDPDAIFEWRDNYEAYRSDIEGLWREVKEASSARFFASACRMAERRLLSGEKVVEVIPEIVAQYEGHMKASGRLEARRIEEVLAEAMEKPDGVEPKIWTGYQLLDQRYGGFRPGELIIIGARAGTGKTTFSTNLAQRIAGNGAHALYITCEEDAEQIARKVGAVSVQADFWATRDRSFLKGLEIPLWILDAPGGLEIEGMASMIAAAARDHGIKLVIVDTLSQVEARGQGDRRQQLTYITANLKRIARRFGIVMVVISQLNRESDKGDSRPPRLSDLKDSGSIEQDSDMVILLHRAEDSPNNTTMTVAKNRRGRGVERVKLSFDPSCFDLSEVTR